MNKLAAIVLLVALLLLPTLPVAADMPIPNYFFVEVGGACWLPDGNGMPARVDGVNTEFSYEKPNILVISCNGKLPAGATIPRVITKYEFRNTGKFCIGKLKSSTRITSLYGAVVYPDGWSEITCRFDLSAQDP